MKRNISRKGAKNAKKRKKSFTTENTEVTEIVKSVLMAATRERSMKLQGIIKTLLQSVNQPCPFSGDVGKGRIPGNLTCYHKY